MRLVLIAGKDRVVSGLEVERRVRIGVDIDGVLANHAAALVERVEKRYGVSLSYQDLRWNLPVGPTDLFEEIMEAMQEPEWVRAIPVYPGAETALARLQSLARVVVITARPASTLEATARWLGDNHLPFDDFVRCRDADKPRHQLDLLVDDYLPNVHAFIAAGSGGGVLVDRPWNREGREELTKSQAGFRVVGDVGDVAEVVRILQARSK